MFQQPISSAIRILGRWDVTSLIVNEHLFDDVLMVSSTLSWQIRVWCSKLFSLGHPLAADKRIPHLVLIFFNSSIWCLFLHIDEFDIPNLLSCQQAIVNHVFPSKTSRLSASKSRKTVAFRIAILCSIMSSGATSSLQNVWCFWSVSVLYCIGLGVLRSRAG